MTKSDWLSTASIVMSTIMTLLSPVWGLWIIKRITQPKPTPAENTDAKRPNWISRLVDKSWFLPGLIVIFGASQLLRDLREKSPVTRHTVVDIAVDVALIFYGLAGMTIFSIISTLRDMGYVHQGTLEILKHVTKILEPHPDKTPKKKTSKKISN